MQVIDSLDGVDYVVACWMGRHHGHVEDDAPGTCLQRQDP